MTTYTTSKLSLVKHTTWLRLLSLNFIITCAVMVMATTAAVAQEAKSKPTLVPGSEVNLAAATKVDWVQGEGPTTFEPGKVYVFECWATWCGPCVALIPHVNHLHKKYYDKGLRVHGMNCWEEGRKLTVDYVKAKGEGMSYPVAYTHGSAFETEWLEASGVESIPHAFVVRNGKLLLGTEAVRLTDSLVELMLSGDEGAEKAAAIIKAAYDARDEVRKLGSEIYQAKRKKNAELMAAKIKEVETLDPGHPDLSKWKLELLMVQENWPAAIAALDAMPASSTKNTYLAETSRLICGRNADAYPISFAKSFTPPYAKYISDGGKGIGPSHFAKLAMLYWKLDDKQAAITTTNKAVEAAINHKTGASEYRTIAYKRFAKSVKEGTMPNYPELILWQAAAKKEAAAAKQ